MSALRIARTAIMVLALALQASSDACPPGVAAPSVTTLMASTEKPNDMWIVNADCTYSTTQLDANGGATLAAVNINRIASVPAGMVSLVTQNIRFSRGADFSAAKEMKLITMFQFEAALIDNLILPSGLWHLQMSFSVVQSFDKVTFPDSITELNLISVGISSLKNLPASVTSLSLQTNAFSSISFPMPPKLQRLIMDANPIAKLERVRFPDSLKLFSCRDCTIESIRGVKWSSNLATLDLQYNQIREFELRQSDFEVLSKVPNLELATILQTCSDEQATMKEIGTNKVCVISGAPWRCSIVSLYNVLISSSSRPADERFEALYSANSDGEFSSSGSSNADTASTSASADESGTSDGSDSRSNTTSSATGGSTASSVGGQTSNGQKGANSPLSPNNSDATTNDTSISSTVLGVLIALGCVSCILLAVIVYRSFRSSRRRIDKEDDKTPGNPLVLVDTPMFTSSQDHSSSNGGTSQEYLPNDIRNDKSIIQFIIDQNDITISNQIARGGFGAIYRGMYNRRAVAVKQMLPDAWRNEAQLASFMDEIRLCASLSHPKIIEFIGVAWTSLRDISVVIEFMAGGDLGAVLQKHAHSQSLVLSTVSLRSEAAQSSLSSAPFVPSPRDWSERWTIAGINSKTLIAKDVAEAVVYLHSFSDPVIHRDLKARNVLLDLRGNAKLSDFGISREMATDQTMTSEVGTSAWIAPEVLRGDRYSEQADIYSFGVLLVELDKCRHPYAGEDTLVLMGGGSVRMAPSSLQEQAHNTRSQAMHQNMQIAMLVSAGHLRPKPSPTCPARVQALVARCLSFAPEDRPTAMQVHYELRQILVEM